MANILIIDDNEEILLALRLFLQDHFSHIDTDTRPHRIPHYMDSMVYDVIVLDMNFRAGVNSGNEGLYWMHRILERDAQAVIVFITAYGDVQLAVRAIQEGAVDFIEKPWDEDRLLATLLKAEQTRKSKMEIGKLRRKQNHLREQLEAEMGDVIYGDSPAMQSLWNTVGKVAPTDANILILGENGTGKEVVAREIHRKSLRSDEIFVGVDMGSITPTLFESELFGHRKGAFTGAISDRVGRFEVAVGGTLFLDEIGNLTMEQQAKLLSVLQNKRVIPVGGSNPIDVDVRLIAATNSDLDRMVSQGLFREDLLYRLNTIRLEVPPLRDRKEDIPSLAGFYLEQFVAKYKKEGLTFGSGVMRKLKGYSWPGNVRELQHVVEKAVIMSEVDLLKVEDFLFSPHDIKRIESSAIGESLNLEVNERELIRQAIEKAHGNYSQAVKELGITRKTLYNKIKKYGL